MSYRPRNLIGALVASLAAFGFTADPAMVKEARYEFTRIRSQLGHSTGNGKRHQRHGTRKRCVSKPRKRARCVAKRRAHK